MDKSKIRASQGNIYQNSCFSKKPFISSNNLSKMCISDFFGPYSKTYIFDRDSNIVQDLAA